MSSNLLKQQFIYNEQSVTRIINSNHRMEEKMRELARVYEIADKNSATVAPDATFVEGILASDAEEMIPEAPKVDLDALLAEAQAEANRIVEEARNSASLIISEANDKAAVLFEEQKQAGYMEGVALVEQECNQRKEQLDEQYRARQEELEQNYIQKLDEMECDIVDAIIQVFNHVFHIQFEDKKDILLHLIQDTLQNIEAGKHFRIMVSEENWQYVDEHLEELRAELGSNVTLEVARDMKLSKSDCRIETEFGVYDCGIDLELDGLYRDIRSLCSGGASD